MARLIIQVSKTGDTILFFLIFFVNFRTSLLPGHSGLGLLHHLVELLNCPSAVGYTVQRTTDIMGEVGRYVYIQSNSSMAWQFSLSITLQLRHNANNQQHHVQPSCVYTFMVPPA